MTIVLYGGLDSVLGQDRTVDFHRRQGQFLRDSGVLDFTGLVESFAFDPLRDQRATRNR